MAELLPAVPSAPPDIPQLVQRYLNGESIAALKVEYGCCRKTLYNWIHSEVADQYYPQLVRQALVNRLAEADEQLEEADSLIAIARAREIAKYTYWIAERRLRMFQPQSRIEQDRTVTVIIQRETPQPVVVETIENRKSEE